MKTKKLNKKLVLDKETLTCLENDEMSVVKAGGSPWVDEITDVC